MLIKGPETLAVGRLVLDHYSATLDSASPHVSARIEDLVKEGHDLADAIEMVAFPDFVRMAPEDGDIQDEDLLEAAE